MFDIGDYDLSNNFSDEEDYSYLDNPPEQRFIPTSFNVVNLSNGDIEETSTFSFGVGEFSEQMMSLENMFLNIMARNFARSYLNNPNNPNRSTTPGGATDQEIDEFIQRIGNMAENGENDELNRLFEQFKKEGPPPASEESLKNLILMEPKEFSELHKNNSDNCSICQSELIDTEGKICCLPCKHFFHDDCVKQWLKMHNACPICRNKI